jgi:putative flippase GtrA
MSENFQDGVMSIRQIREEGIVKFVINLTKETCRLAPSRNLKVQLIRSLIVSVISLVADFSALVVLKEGLDVHYLAASTMGFILGVIVNYALSTKWVFALRKLESKHTEFVIFVVICATGLILNLLIIAAIVESLGIDYRIGKVIATVVVFFWNFFARKKLLY